MSAEFDWGSLINGMSPSPTQAESAAKTRQEEFEAYLERTKLTEIPGEPPRWINVPNIIPILDNNWSLLRRHDITGIVLEVAPVNNGRIETEMLADSSNPFVLIINKIPSQHADNPDTWKVIMMERSLTHGGNHPKMHEYHQAYGEPGIVIMPQNADPDRGIRFEVVFSASHGQLGTAQLQPDHEITEQTYHNLGSMLPFHEKQRRYAANYLAFLPEVCESARFSRYIRPSDQDRYKQRNISLIN